MDYEIYEGRTEGQNRKKKYLVFPWTIDGGLERENTAKRFFRCNPLHLKYYRGWILNDELYLEDPHKKGKKRVAVYTYKQ